MLETIIATIIYFAATSVLVERVLDKMASKRANKKKVTNFTEESLISTDIKNSDEQNGELGFMPPTQDADEKGDE